MRWLPVVALLLCTCQGTVRLYPGEPRPAAEVATLHVRGDGALSVPDPPPGEVSYEAALTAHNGKPTANPLHKVELLPGSHEFEIRWSRWETPSIGTSAYAFGPRWVKSAEGTQRMYLRVEAGKRYWLDWIPEWRTDRPPGPPMRFMTTVDGKATPAE